MRWCCGCAPSGSSSVSESHAAPLVVGSNHRRSGQHADDEETVAMVSQTSLSSPPVTAHTTIARSEEGNNHRETSTPPSGALVTPHTFYYSPGKTHIYHQLPTSGAISGGQQPQSQTGPIPPSTETNTVVVGGQSYILDRFGSMLLRPCKSVLFVTSNPTSTSVECAFIQRLKKSDWSVHRTSPGTAKDDFQKYRPVVVLLDSRLPNLQSTASSLHSLPESEDVLFSVLCDRTLSDKRRKALESDFHQYFLASSTDISLCELFAKVSARLRAIPALFAVVEEAEQPIKICDENNVVQYVNRAYEHITGVNRAEVLGKDSAEVRIKTTKTASLPSTIVPSSAPADTIDRNSFIARRRSSEWHCITVPSSSASPQYVYVKRGSADVAICRDLSLKSLRSAGALVDAPITEAMSVLANLMHRCDEDIQPMVKEAIKILSNTELYAPSITRFRDNDRIASGYYEGLIRLHQPSRHRKRSVVDAFRDHQVTGKSNRRVSHDIVNALEHESSWNFDVIALERITQNHALSNLGAKIYERWNVAETLRCSMDVIFKWLQVIEANYHHSNSYHNSTHAADVLQATSFFLGSEVVAQYVQDVHAVAALIAATVHDLDHPGRGNAFLMNTRHKLALLYNDHSVLESHHVALAFQLTLAQPGVNIFARLPREEFTNLRHAIIDMVLATDMSRHFEYLTKFQQLSTNIHEIEDISHRDANSLTICRMLIKCADIGNPCRDWKICKQWGMRIVEEYFEQTTEEIEKCLPVTMKGFDRETCNVPMTQCTFIDMFAREAFSSWCEFAELPQLLNILESNYENWKEQASSWDPANNTKLFDYFMS